MGEIISKPFTYYPGGDVSNPTIETDIKRYGRYVTTCVIDVETLLQGRKSFPCGNGDDYVLSGDEQKELLAFYEKEEQKRCNDSKEYEEDER